MGDGSTPVGVPGEDGGELPAEGPGGTPGDGTGTGTGDGGAGPGGGGTGDGGASTPG
jgi:hypothetical protein